MSTHSLLRLLQNSKKHWFGITGIVFFSVLAGPLKTQVAVLWGHVVDTTVAGYMDIVPTIVITMVILLVLDSLRTISLYKLIGKTIEDIFANLRMQIFNALAKADSTILENSVRSGDTALRIGDDIETLANNIGEQFPNSIRLISQGVFAFITCIYLSWQLSITYLILLPLSFFLTQKISKPIEVQLKVSSNIIGGAMSLCTDIISGIDNIKSYNLQNEMNRRFGDTMKKSYTELEKVEKISVRLTIVRYTFSVLQIMSLFLIGTWLVSQGVITIGAVIAFVALSIYIKELFEISGYIFYIFRSSVARAERVYEIIDLPEERSGDIIISETFDDNLIKMSNLSFSYDAKNPNLTLDQVNFTLNKNQKIAIIGSSGCGKSTLIKLICRFITEIHDGELSLYGINASNINTRSLRQRIALVSQDSVIFAGSIYENVAYGKPDATNDEILRAIKYANLMDYVNTLPEKAHTIIGEFGMQLSGGQRQRIAIARAFLKGADIVILDEATSALDTQTEKEVQLALDALLVGRAAIIVAHRLSTVKNVDYLYCMESGKIIEEGQPNNLIEKKGYYYNMCLKQEVI